MKRRQFIKNSLTVSGIFLIGSQEVMCKHIESNKMRVEAIHLRYDLSALAPYISENTLSYHYGKHLQSYVNTLKELIKGTAMENLSVEEIFLGADEGALFNNAGQTLNHNLYFQQFAPVDSRKAMPTGKLSEAIISAYGSFEKMQEEMNAASTSLFGSGWVWLSSNKQMQLSIQKCPNGTNPLRQNLTPLLGFDVWEHAYYLDYQNRRVDHIKALWNVIDWQIIEKRFI